jgi:hypothetical protein
MMIGNSANATKRGVMRTMQNSSAKPTAIIPVHRTIHQRKNLQRGVS